MELQAGLVGLIGGEGRGNAQVRRMISLAHSYLWIFGGIISYPREP